MMRVETAVHAAGNSHPGLLRDGNEDRFHCDPARGVFVVIDGVGGHAAGEKAADTALAKIRERLESGGGRAEDRVRAAITNANNEVHRLAAIRPEWKGMACVLTVAVLDNGDAVVGHVGDTRLYKLRGGRIEKLTRDHSPVGEREDDGELTEQDAMRHPRRNEVYRDVGSEPHLPSDPEFIDVFRVPFEADAALLLCSDGLTDTVESGTINAIVQDYAGHAYEIVRALIDAANRAGGKDNVTVVYVEGSRFAQGEDTRDVARRGSASAQPAAPAVQSRDAARAPADARRLPAREGGSVEMPHEGASADAPVSPKRASHAREGGPRVPRRDAVVEDAAPPRGRAGTLAIVAAIVVVLLATAAYVFRDRWLDVLPLTTLDVASTSEIVVARGGSIQAAIAAARPGTRIVVEPGEYRERLILTNGVSVRSRVPRAAEIRMPASASESDVAVVAVDVADAELNGFRIVGDAATPLGIGVLQRNAAVRLIDIEVAGARQAALEFGTGATGALLASELHDNPGLAIVVRGGAAPRIAHSSFARNATAAHAPAPVVVEAGGRVELRRNVFYGTTPESLILPPGAAGAIASENWFIPAAPDRGAQRGSPGGRRGR